MHHSVRRDARRYDLFLAVRYRYSIFNLTISIINYTEPSGVTFAFNRYVPVSADGKTKIFVGQFIVGTFRYRCLCQIIGSCREIRSDFGMIPDSCVSESVNVTRSSYPDIGR